MKLRNPVFAIARIAGVLLLVGLLTGTVIGQVRGHSSGGSAAKAPAEKSENLIVRKVGGPGSAGLVKPPWFNFSGGTVGKSRTPTRDWGRISLEYDTNFEWADQLTITYYAMLRTKDKSAETPYSLLEGTVTYIDVKKGNGHKAEAFIRPRTLERYGEIVGVAAVITVGDETVSMSEVAINDMKGDWWNTLASNKTVTPRGGYIIARNETPFALVNYQDYETISR